jgi:hypothetical protein
MSTNSIIYFNKEYKFSVSFPKWWERYCYIHTNNVIEEAEATISINMKYARNYNGKKETNVFRIVVFRMSKSQWDENYKESPFSYIAHRNGRVFTYIPSNEPPREFLKKDKSDFDYSNPDFQRLLKMINEDLPKIIKSFKFRC